MNWFKNDFRRVLFRNPFLLGFEGFFIGKRGVLVLSGLHVVQQFRDSFFLIHTLGLKIHEKLPQGPSKRNPETVFKLVAFYVAFSGFWAPGGPPSMARQLQKMGSRPEIGRE